MKRQHNMRPLVIAATLLALAGGALSAGPASAGEAAFDPDKAVVKPSHAVVYGNINPAIQMGAGFGDMSNGAHGTFGKFPADFITPFHTHTGAYHAVVLGGTMTNPFEAEDDPPQMEAGSYWYVPAGMVHATACVSATPCQFYFHAASGFDFTPVE